MIGVNSRDPVRPRRPTPPGDRGGKGGKNQGKGRYCPCRRVLGPDSPTWARPTLVGSRGRQGGTLIGDWSGGLRCPRGSTGSRPSHSGSGPTSAPASSTDPQFRRHRKEVPHEVPHGVWLSVGFPDLWGGVRPRRGPPDRSPYLEGARNLTPGTPEPEEGYFTLAPRGYHENRNHMLQTTRRAAPPVSVGCSPSLHDGEGQGRDRVGRVGSSELRTRFRSPSVSRRPTGARPQFRPGTSPRPAVGVVKCLRTEKEGLVGRRWTWPLQE